MNRTIQKRLLFKCWDLLRRIIDSEFPCTLNVRFDWIFTGMNTRAHIHKDIAIALFIFVLHLMFVDYRLALGLTCA